MKILVIDCGSSKVPHIIRILGQLSCNTTCIKLQDLEETGGYSGIIISGAPILLTEQDPAPYLEKAATLFANQENPVLGICFGHQLMGLYHGATIRRCTEDRDFQKIIFPVPHPFINETPGVVSFHEDHCECIDLPGDFERLGSSVICTNEAMMHKNKPWFGVQFHPETSGEAGETLIGNFIRYCREFTA